MDHTKPHVLIVGGGIGGLTLAQCLRKRGISFEIFERDPDWRTSGWCITIHSLIPELIAAIPEDVPDLALTNHLLPLDLPSQSVAYLADKPGVKYGVTSRGITDMVRANRGLLRQFLTTKISCHMNKRAIYFEESSESVTVQFDDGTNATGTILVGADGANSLLRGQLLGRDIKPQLLPVVTIGGEVTLSGSDFENELRLGHSSRSNYFSAPPDPSLPTVYLFCALKRVLPDGLSGEYYWFATWTDDTIGNPDHWTHTASPEELHEFVVRATRHIAPELRNTIDLTPVNTFRGNPFPQRALVLPDMPTGRVTLLGDAAHCMPPNRGEAGVHAMRDALNLAECIGNIDPSNDRDGYSTKKAIGAYQEEMLQRSRVTVQRNVEASRMNSSSMGWGGRDIEPLEEENISLANIGRVKAVA